MRNQLICFLTLLFCTSFYANAETEYAKQLVLQTDKKVYVSGEEIGFKCTLVKQQQQRGNILFVDVCGEGYIISSRILKQKNSHWDGKISLPDTLQTGIYLLRAYIGNNRGEPTLVSEPVTVFNRFGNNEINTIRQSKPGYQPLIQQHHTQLPESTQLKTNASGKTFSTQHEIEFWVENSLTHPVGGISFSVFKTDLTTDSNDLSVPHYDPFSKSDFIKIFPQLILSGRLLHASTRQPAADETILLSIPDSIANVNYTISDSTGEFKFMLDHSYGLQDMIVQTMNKQIDFQLTLNPILLLPPNQIPFYIPAQTESGEFTQLAIQRTTLHQAYGTSMVSESKKAEVKIPFYGWCNNRVYPEIFVPLNNFNEIAFEILPTVRYRLDKDSCYVRLWDPVSKGFFYNPWILVDGVPIFNPAHLNVLHSEMIKWIEIQPQVRCYGNLFIEGVLSIQTFHSDYSDVEFPKNAIRRQIDTFYEFNVQAETEQPLFRDILYWNPVLNSNERVQTVKVKSSFEKGTYVAIAQTVDQSGQVQQSVFQFNVE